MAREYRIGDTVYLANGGKSLVRGKVIHIVNDLPDNWGPQYIIEIPTHIDPYLEIRDWECLSDTPEGPLNIWKNSAVSQFLNNGGKIFCL